MAMAAAEVWPRDFRREDEPTGGLMFIGSALRWINKAVDRTADDDDVSLGRSFVDRPDRDNPHRIEHFQAQRWAYRRGETARAILIDWLRRGRVEAFWLSEDGQFERIPRKTWGWQRRAAYVLGLRRRHNVHASSADGALRQFEMADGYYRGRGASPPSGRRFVYVSAKQLLSGLVGLNSGAERGFPDEPDRQLDKFGPRASDDWPLLTALTWIATRDEGATAGALAYPEIWSRGSYAQVAASATNGFINHQIANFFCKCRKPTCICWASAKVLLGQAAQGSTPAIAGYGFRDNQGDAEQIPGIAWRGAFSFDECGWLEPERIGGTRWGSVFFCADDVRNAFPSAAIGGDDAGITSARTAGGWKTWAKNAVDRGVGIRDAHGDARRELGDHAPGQIQARELIRSELESRGKAVRQGRPAE